MKKALSLLLLSALLLSACSSGNPPADTTASEQSTSADTTAEITTTTPEVTTTPEDLTKDDLPATMDFSGTTIGIASSTGTYFTGYLDVQEPLTVLDEAIYQRTRGVEERLKVKFTEMLGKADDLKTLTNNCIIAGDDSYQIIHLSDRRSFASSVDGMFLDLATEVPHVNLKKDYWYELGNEILRIGGKQYTAFSDISLTTYDYTHMIVFNKEMFSAYNLKSPYEYFQENNWTFDVFASMVAVGKNDLNGDGVMNDMDQYSFFTRGDFIYPLFYTAAGLKTITVDKDGTPTFAVPGNEKFVDVYTWCETNMMPDGITHRRFKGNDFHIKLPLFAQNRALMADITFFGISLIREMESDYGVVVYPKLTADQERYYSWTEGGAKSIAVPIITKNKEAVGATLEAMGSLSLKNLIPIYYEINMKAKYARDKETTQMFDVIRDTRTFDLGDNVWNTARDQLGKALRDGIPLASTVESMRPVVEQLIAETLQKLNKPS